MNSQTKSPGTLANDGAVGTEPWQDPTNAASSNDSYATIIDEGQSNYLKATNFDFTIPAGFVLTGIVVAIERKELDEGIGSNDLVLRLVVGGVISGSNKANVSSFWPEVDTIATYGSPSDLWGLPTLSRADVNAVDFGVVLQIDHFGSSPVNISSVDHIEITAYYLVRAMPPVSGFFAVKEA